MTHPASPTLAGVVSSRLPQTEFVGQQQKHSIR